MWQDAAAAAFATEALQRSFPHRGVEERAAIAQSFLGVATWLTLRLDAQLKALRLPTFLREYDKVARQCAQEELDCPRYLLRLCELEWLSAPSHLDGNVTQKIPLHDVDQLSSR